jgi:AraC family transcriptional regulator of adaptative response/methylated-DNA-[protein]-cysteine methyltransferase
VIATYQDIANYIEKPNAVRAVASAIGKNHIGYLIPCHRVIAKSGAMSGYRWGIERKKILIAYESTHKENAVEVRNATLKDVPSLCTFIKSVSPKKKEDEFDHAAMLSHWIENTHSHSLLLAIQEQEIVGMVTLMHTTFLLSGERSAYVMELIVSKQNEQSALNALFESAMSVCVKKGCQKLVVLSKISDVKLYKTLGFKQIQEETFVYTIPSNK